MVNNTYKLAPKEVAAEPVINVKRRGRWGCRCKGWFSKPWKIATGYRNVRIIIEKQLDPLMRSAGSVRPLLNKLKLKMERRKIPHNNPMDYSKFAHDVHIILASFIYIYIENDTVTYVAPLSVEVTVKPVLSGRSKKTKNGVQDRLSLNADQQYCRMLQGEHSAIISTFIKLTICHKDLYFVYF